MSTKVFLRGQLGAACDNWGSGVAVWNPNSAYSTTSVVGTPIYSCRLTPGAGVASQLAPTVASGTSRYRFGGNGTTPFMWVTPPIDRDVTISGTVTVNLWGLESSMSANCQLTALVGRIDSTGTVAGTHLFDVAVSGVELNTSASVVNFNVTPTSTAFLKGDRLLIVPFMTNIGTMASGFTVTFDYDGATSTADGDSWIFFTEDFGFIQDAPGTLTGITSGSGSTAFGNVAVTTRLAFPFRLAADSTVSAVAVGLLKNGTPADDVQLAIQADSSGSPSDTDLVSGSVAGSGVTGSVVQTSFSLTPTALAANTQYWVVLRRSGANDNANNYSVGLDTTGVQPWAAKTYLAYDSGTGWGSPSTGSVRLVLFTFAAGSTLYPTNTTGAVDPNGASYDSKEVWTSRGAGVQTAIVNTAAAPASALLWTTSAGGNFVEWFSRQLQAFTLGGAVLVNVRTNESGAGAEATVGAEIAVCNSDGTSPVVWGDTFYGVEVATSETAYQFLISGDDTAVTDGKRLRVRFYTDDQSNAAMQSGFTMTMRYAGAAGATGDTYLTFPQTLAEVVAAGGIAVASHLPFIPRGRNM